MRGMDIFQKPYCREISTMRGRPMRGLPVVYILVYVQFELLQQVFIRIEHSQSYLL